MKTHFFRKTINTCIYLEKKTVINNKSADMQVHNESDGAKSIPKATVVFIHFLIY